MSLEKKARCGAGFNKGNPWYWIPMEIGGGILVGTGAHCVGTGAEGGSRSHDQGLMSPLLYH
jgi:hypothetical protein